MLLKKAQVFSADMIIAVLFFLVILLASAFIWDYSQENIILTEQRNDLNLISQHVLSSLIEKKGVPFNWSDYDFNKTNVKSVGLASEPWVLDRDKVESLSDADYNTSKRILGILGPGYEYMVKIKQWNGTDYETNMTIGSGLTAPLHRVITTRFALLENKWTMLELNLWEECYDDYCE